MEENQRGNDDRADTDANQGPKKAKKGYKGTQTRNTKTLVLRLVSVSELVTLLKNHPELVSDSVSYSSFKQSQNYSTFPQLYTPEKI